RPGGAGDGGAGAAGDRRTLTRCQPPDGQRATPASSTVADSPRSAQSPATLRTARSPAASPPQSGGAASTATRWLRVGLWPTTSRVLTAAGVVVSWSSSELASASYTAPVTSTGT